MCVINKTLKFIKTFETGIPVNYFPSKYFYALADTITLTWNNADSDF